MLVPAYTSRQSGEKQIGDIVTIEVGMLAEALATAVHTSVRLVPTAGKAIELRVPLPHPLAALTLKLSSWTARRATKDAFDVWRCLEICAHDQLSTESWTDAQTLRAFASQARRADFARLDGDGIVAAVGYTGSTGDNATRDAARIVALGDRLFGIVES